MSTQAEQETRPDHDETLVAFGGEIKALSGGRFGGYLVRFGDPDHTDLEREYFTKETDFGSVEETGQVAIYYQHGFDYALKGRKLTVAEAKKDDIGLWIEYQLELRDEYEEAIAELTRQGKFGLSSGAVAYLVEREQMGKSAWLKAWPIGEGSITPTPAEPRTNVVPLKSIQFDQDALKSAEKKGVAGIEVPVTVTVDFKMNGHDLVATTQDTKAQESGPKAAGMEAGATAVDQSREHTPQATTTAQTETTIMADEKKTAEQANEKEQQAPEQKAATQEPKSEAKNEAVLEQLKAIQEQMNQMQQSKTRDVTAEYDVSDTKTQEFGSPNLSRLPAKFRRDDTGLGAYEYYMRTGDDGARKAYQDALKANAVDLQEGTDAEGGYVVHNDHATQIVAKRDEMSVPRRAGAQIFTTSSNVIDIPLENTSLSKFAITSEEATYDKDTPGLGNAQVTVYKFTKLMRVSEELLEDHDSNLLDFITEAVGRSMAVTENSYTLVGTGTGQPEGIFNKTADNTFAGTAAITADEVQEIYYGLEGPYRDGAVWAMHNDTERAIRSLQGSDFLFRSTPAGQVNSGNSDGADTLLNRRVYNSSEVAQLATGNKTVAFGNWSFYGLIEKRGLTVRRLNELYAASGQVGFLFSFRFGGKILQEEAFEIGQQA